MTDKEICSYIGELRTVFGFKKLTHSPERQKIRTQKYRTEGGFNVCQGIREMIEDGRQDGVKGGRMEQARDMALSLSGMGISAEKIAEAAKVSLETVQKWLRLNDA